MYCFVESSSILVTLILSKQDEMLWYEWKYYMIDNININENQSKMSWIIMSFSILRYEYKQFLLYYQDIVVDEYLTPCGKKGKI